jgi:hypothetical protein
LTSLEKTLDIDLNFHKLWTPFSIKHWTWFIYYIKKFWTPILNFGLRNKTLDTDLKTMNTEITLNCFETEFPASIKKENRHRKSKRWN